MSLAEILSKAARSDGGLSGANWAGGPLDGFRNKIINGDFDVWQRGTSVANNSGYLADRWRTTASGANGLACSRQDFTPGQTDVPGNPKHFYRLSFTAGNDYARTEQHIEDVRTLAGKTVTVTFWAKGTNPGGGAFYSYLGQDFGTGGSPSAANLVLEPHPFVVTNAWQKFSLVKQVPSIAGKTIGTDGNSRLLVSFGQFDDISTAAWTLDLAHVSIVEGDATGEDDPFAKRHFQEELTLCQRYFWKSYPVDVAPGSTGSTADSSSVESFSAGGLRDELLVSWRFPYAMRAAPTVVIYSPSTGATGVTRQITGTPADIAASVVGITTAIGFRSRPDASPAITNSRCLWHATADADL